MGPNDLSPARPAPSPAPPHDPLPPSSESIGLTPEELDRLPRLPGVYRMRGEKGEVLYVGKAADLRSRVRGYFTKSGDARFNVVHLMKHVRRVETIVTATEQEAFLLENNLIKLEQPRYNIRLRDDKTYVSVRVDLSQPWPRAVVLRRRHEKRDGATYLGPFASAAGVRETLRLLQRVFPIRSCADHVLKNRSRPCLLHQIGRCCAPCVKPVDPKEYREMIEGTILVLKGRGEDVLARLREKMARHSEAMEFESAAVMRDRIAAIERTGERQLVHRHDGRDRDAVALERGSGKLGFAVFGYRGGLLVHSRPFLLPDHDRPGEELMAEFLARYYENEKPPPEILCSPAPAEAEFLAARLGERREGRCEISSPERGERARLVEMARENCARMLAQRLAGTRSLEEIHAEIMDRLDLDAPPDPIECYDISTIQGTNTVGAMVTFREGEPDKARYRHFLIKSVAGQDDFASLREMLERRLRRVAEGEEPAPGLLLIDGGKGQLGVAEAVLEDLGLSQLPLASIAKMRVKRRGDREWKTEERFFLPGRKNPVTFPAGGAALHLLQRVRDEAHRFGITHHRKLRTRTALRSSLEDLPGVGKKTAAALLRAFGSLEAMREAGEDALAATPGVTRKAARAVAELLAGAGEVAVEIGAEPESASEDSTKVDS